MAAKKHVLGLIDAGREVRRPPLVGMQFLHERPVGLSDVLRAGPRLKAKDLIGLLFRHFAARRSALPRVRTALRVFAPSGAAGIAGMGEVMRGAARAGGVRAAVEGYLAALRAAAE